MQVHYGVRTGKDRQTGLAKKSGERWRKTKIIIKKQKGKERERQLSIAFSSPHSLSALHIYFSATPTHTDREECRTFDTMQRRENIKAEPEQMAKAWRIWSRRPFATEIRAHADKLKKMSQQNALPWDLVFFFRSGGCKCVCKQYILFHPSRICEIKQSAFFFFFFGSIRNDTTLLAAVSFQKTAPENAPSCISLITHQT